MAVSFVGHGGLADAVWPNTSGSQNTSIPIHASTVLDDFMLLWAVHRGDVASLTGPGGGWAEVFNGEGIVPQVNDGGHLGLFWKIHDGSEAEPSITWGTGAGPRNAGILSYRDVDPTTPFNQMPANLSGNAAAQNIGPIAGFTPDAGVGAIVVIGIRGDDWTSVATLTGESLTWNERVEEDTTAGNDMGVVIDDTLGWTSGAIAAKTFTVTGGGALNRGAGIMFGLNNVLADTQEPTNTVLTGPTLARISAQAGFDETEWTWEADEDFVTYEIRIVPSSSSDHTEGALLETDVNPAAGGTAGTDYTAGPFTDDDIQAVDPGDGTKILKVFTQDAAGNWSV